MKILSTFLLCCVLSACSYDGSGARDEAFTIVMIPDTQNAVDFTRQKAEGFAIDSSEIFIEQMRHIADRSASSGGDVAFVASVGDVWQHVTSDTDPGHVARGIEAVTNSAAGFQRFIHAEGALSYEIPKSIEGYRLISNSGIPFGVAPGNHDYDAWWAVAGPPEGNTHIGGLNNFRMAFGSDTEFFADKDWYVSAFQGGGSSAQVFSAGGYRFLHLAFEMHAGDDVVAWAKEVVGEYAGLPTIISTHDYLNNRGERLPARNMDLALADPEHNNSAEELWQEFIRKTDQVFMVLSGHQPGQAIRIDTNDFGHAVYQILADFQVRGQAGLDAGQALGPGGGVVGIGDGWFREMTFHLWGEDPRVDVRTYSSHYASYSSELDTYADWYKSREQPGISDEQFLEADEFSLELADFRARYGMPSEL